MALSLRPLTPETVELFIKLMIQLNDEDPGPFPLPIERARRQTLEILQRPTRVAATFLVDDETVVGYAILVPYYSNEYGGEILYLDEFLVLPEYRGKGLGRTFLEQLKVLAAEQGMVRICLEVHAENGRAAKLYERAGFEDDGRLVYGFQVKPLSE